MNQSHGAFLLNCQAIFDQISRTRNGFRFVYLWTLTFPELTTVKVGSKKFDKFTKWYRYHFPTQPAIRVYELHKNGSLHIHLIIPFRLDVNKLRKYLLKVGFGRIHAKVLNCEKCRNYLAKYLTKQRIKRYGSLKNVRLWQTLNFENNILCKKVKTYNFSSSVYKKLLLTVPFEFKSFCLERHLPYLDMFLSNFDTQDRFKMIQHFLDVHYYDYMFYVLEICPEDYCLIKL